MPLLAMICSYLVYLLANHPGLHMPRAATSWASCLFAVDGLIIQIKLLMSQQSKLY
nr:MAG TPA: hypothetical protein [Caudoviricetes sp.]